MRISSENEEHFFSLCHSVNSLYTCSYRFRDFAGNNVLPMILSASAFNSCMIEFSIPDFNETIIKNIISLFSKRRARDSTLEAFVMAVKTTIHERSRLRARGSIYALASVREELNHLLWHARGSTYIR